MNQQCKICLGEHPGTLCPVIDSIMAKPNVDEIMFDHYGRIARIKFKEEEKVEKKPPPPAFKALT
jgi:hypothetical protein